MIFDLCIIPDNRNIPILESASIDAIPDVSEKNVRWVDGEMGWREVISIKALSGFRDLFPSFSCVYLSPDGKKELEEIEEDKVSSCWSFFVCTLHGEGYGSRQMVIRCSISHPNRSDGWEFAWETGSGDWFVPLPLDGTEIRKDNNWKYVERWTMLEERSWMSGIGWLGT